MKNDKTSPPETPPGTVPPPAAKPRSKSSRRKSKPRSRSLPRKLVRQLLHQTKHSYRRLKARLHSRWTDPQYQRLKRVLLGLGIAAALVTAILVALKSVPLILALLSVLGLCTAIAIFRRIVELGSLPARHCRHE